MKIYDIFFATTKLNRWIISKNSLNVLLPVYTTLCPAKEVGLDSDMGQPQWMQAAALSDISLPHSEHFIKAIYLVLLSIHTKSMVIISLSAGNTALYFPGFRQP